MPTNKTLTFPQRPQVMCRSPSWMPGPEKHGWDVMLQERVH